MTHECLHYNKHLSTFHYSLPSTVMLVVQPELGNTGQLLRYTGTITHLGQFRDTNSPNCMLLDCGRNLRITMSGFLCLTR